MRLLSTCVNCPMYSWLRSSVSIVDAGWLVEEPLPNGSKLFCPDAFPMMRVFEESWESPRLPCRVRVLLSASEMLNLGYGVVQTLVFGDRSYSKLPKKWSLSLTIGPPTAVLYC